MSAERVREICGSSSVWVIAQGNRPERWDRTFDRAVDVGARRRSRVLLAAAR